MRVMGLMSDGLYIQVSYIFHCVSVKKRMHGHFIELHAYMYVFFRLIYPTKWNHCEDE